MLCIVKCVLHYIDLWNDTPSCIFIYFQHGSRCGLARPIRYLHDIFMCRYVWHVFVHAVAMPSHRGGPLSKTSSACCRARAVETRRTMLKILFKQHVLFETRIDLRRARFVASASLLLFLLFSKPLCSSNSSF